MTSSSQLFQHEKVSLEIMAPFYRRLATLLSSGVNIALALETQSKSNGEFLNAVVKGLHSSIVDGNSLSRAMNEYPQVFDSFTKGLVRAGEQSGNLVPMIEKLADTSERSLRLKRMTLSSLAYPAILGGTTLGLAVILGTIICSQDDALFAVGGELPTVTRLIVALSKILSDPVFLIIGPISTILLLAFLRHQIASNGDLSYWFDRLQLSLPGLGLILRKLNSARISYVLGLCLEVGIGLIPAIKLTEELTANKYISQKMEAARGDVSQGVSLADSLKNQNLFDPMLVTMVELGEHTGKLAELLLLMSVNLEEELQDALVAFARAIEPVMLVGSGAVVMVVAYGMLAPTLTLLQKL